jgi:hypothetical protein
VLPTVALQCFGALIGACLASVPAWEAGNESGAVGGILNAMLSPAKGFGKFLTVLLALSVVGNVAATSVPSYPSSAPSHNMHQILLHLAEHADPHARAGCCAALRVFHNCYRHVCLALRIPGTR